MATFVGVLPPPITNHRNSVTSIAGCEQYVHVHPCAHLQTKMGPKHKTWYYSITGGKKNLHKVRLNL